MTRSFVPATKHQASMATLPPEIFQIICSHIPLYAHSPTILALAQTNHRLKEIVIPRLLYQHVWLGSEKHACQVLTKLKTQATEIVGQNNLQGIEIPTAHFVRRLCISCELFEDALISSNDSLSQLCALINLGGFPILASLAIHLSDGWLLDYQCDRGTSRFGYFFWRMLKEKCPNLREISLTGVMGDVHNSGLFEYEVQLQSPFAYFLLIYDYRDWRGFASIIDVLCPSR